MMRLTDKVCIVTGVDRNLGNRIAERFAKEGATVAVVDVADILDPLGTIERRGFGRYDVFRNWVDLMLSALQRDDDAYLGLLTA